MPFFRYLIENDQCALLLSRPLAMEPSGIIHCWQVWQDGEVIKSAYLRVYTAGAESSDDPVPGFVRNFGVLSAVESDQTVEWNGHTLTCPSNLRLRVLESTVAFSKAYRGSAVGLIPEAVAASADRELREYRSRHPDHLAHVLTSGWHVPVRWFTVFSPAERQLYETPNGMSIRYRTDMVDARLRVRRAVEILEAVGVFQGPTEELEQLGEWLDQFPDGAMVELDYGAVAELFDSNEILFDDSCEQVHLSLSALAEGDMMGAGEGYGRVIARWSHPFSLSFSS